ncbi:MAG: right-handed parallel beta-helix repeat-containing protein [Euryarchaeota archaeon]|nr:right-handed parallel beta-helix repeat-containing protein [Euryarchaeota archaeon]
MNDKKSILLATAIAAVFLIAAIGSASANGVCCVDYPACTQYFSATDTVTQSCTFNDTMVCTECTGKPAVHALVIGVDDITIDGNGYALIGNVNEGDCEWIDETNPQSGCCGILNLEGYDNVTIKNLEISTFCNGIGLKGAWNNWVEDNRIDNCDIHDNGFNTGWSVSHGIHVVFTKNSTIINNTIHHNKGTGTGCGDGGNGVFVYGSGSGPNYMLIHNNTLYNNRKSGFFTKYMMRNSTLSNNTAYGNGFGDCHECAGINFRCINTDSNIVEHNNCSGNYGSGIYIGGKYNDVRYNIANNNTCNGIFLGRSDGGSRDNDIYNNTVCRNEQDGIDIVNYIVSKQKSYKIENPFSMWGWINARKLHPLCKGIDI